MLQKAVLVLALLAGAGAFSLAPGLCAGSVSRWHATRRAQVRPSSAGSGRWQICEPQTSLAAKKRKAPKKSGGFEKGGKPAAHGRDAGGNGAGAGAGGSDYGGMSAETLLEMLDDIGSGDAVHDDAILRALREKGYAIEIIDESASGEAAYGEGEEDELLRRSELEEALMQASPDYELPDTPPGDALRSDGLACLTDVLSLPTARDLRAFILQTRDEVEAALRAAGAAVEDEGYTDDENEVYTSAVLAPRSAAGRRARWDLKVNARIFVEGFAFVL